MAAGVGLLLEPDAAAASPTGWPASGPASTCIGTRVFLRGSSTACRARSGSLALVATFQLGRLAPALSAHAYLWLLTAWVGFCAALTTRPPGAGDERRLREGDGVSPPSRSAIERRRG